MEESLWGEEFAVNKNSEEDLKKIIKKAKAPKQIKVVPDEKKLKSKSVSIEEKIRIIEEEVNKILGKFKDNTVVIRDVISFNAYIDACIKNKVISIDTETNNSLNTFDCLIMGLCIYTPGQKNAYIPIHHINRFTEELLSNQITENQIKEQLSRLDNVKKVFHNATFDIEVIKQTCGIKLKADWDTMVGAQLLNENELKGLKAQYKLHIDPEQDKYDIEHLFKGLPYEIFDPELFALYAATDAYETYKLYEYQKKEFEKPENAEIYNLFKTIEIPILDVVVDMELTGVEIDTEFAKRLSKVYHDKSDEVQTRIDAELERLSPLIINWRLSPEANAPIIGKTGKEGKSKNQQLADPPELSSPTQMAIMLYDILKAPVLDPKMPRGTGAEILKELSEKIPLCKLLDEKRGYDILINTFIDKMPEVIQKDGRVHARFNTCGTQTGRFSSSDPNLQNIPSKAEDIRLMFRAPKGYAIVGSDYSGQEMRVLASAANDKAMITAYENKQDIYATVASLIYKNNVEDNLEFPPSWGGKRNPEGYARRSKAKTACLGLNYGMGVKTLAERFDETVEDAQKIIDGYYGGLTGVKKYTEESQQMLKKKGYVTDLWGRRRHIPDGMLPEYEIYSETNSYEFNPLLDSPQHLDRRTESLISDYNKKLSEVRWKKERDVIIAQAKKDGLIVKNNGGFINRAMRQCLNARIQGSSATMTKLAMIMAHNDKELNDLGFKLLFTVHDEFAGMCPAENGKRCGERLCEIMIEAAKIKCGNVPWKCDPYIVIDGWYEDNLLAELSKEYNDLKDIKKVQEKYKHLNSDSIELACNGNYIIGRDSIKSGPNYYI